MHIDHPVQIKRHRDSVPQHLLDQLPKARISAMHANVLHDGHRRPAGRALRAPPVNARAPGSVHWGKARRGNGPVDGTPDRRTPSPQHRYRAGPDCCSGTPDADGHGTVRAAGPARASASMTAMGFEERTAWLVKREVHWRGDNGKSATGERASEVPAGAITGVDARRSRHCSQRRDEPGAGRPRNAAAHGPHARWRSIRADAVASPSTSACRGSAGTSAAATAMGLPANG